MKKTLLSSLLALVMLACSWTLWAATARSLQDFKPIAVATVASYDEIKGDVAFFGKISENPYLADGLEAMLNLMTNSQGLAGLDKSRPSGLVVETNGRELLGYAVVPVADLPKLLAVLEPFVGKAEDLGDGVLKIQPKNKPDKPLYIQQKGDWTLASDKPEALTLAPADPAEMFADLATRYDVAVRLLARNVPENLRQKAIADLRRGAESDAAQKPGESDKEYALRQAIGGQLLDVATAVVDDLDEVTVGWSLDHETEKIFAELSVVAKEGSETSRQLAQVQPSPSRFSGFRLAGAALTGNWAGRLPDAKVAILSTFVQTIRKQAMDDIQRQNKPEDEVRIVRQIVGDLLDVVEKTVESGQTDGGLAVMLDPKSATLLAGGYVADGAKLDAVAKQVTDIVRNVNPVAGNWVVLDVEQYHQVALHTVSIPIGYDVKDRDKVVELIGETLEVVVGIGKDSLYVAAGRDAMDKLKQAIESSAAEATTPMPPVQFSLSALPLAKFIAAVGKEAERPKAALVAEQLEKQTCPDHLNLTTSPIDGGLKCRLEFEQGILRLIGSLVAAAKANGS